MSQPEYLIHVRSDGVTVEGCLLLGNPRIAMLGLDPDVKGVTVRSNIFYGSPIPRWWQLGKWIELIRLIKQVA